MLKKELENLKKEQEPLKDRQTRVYTQEEKEDIIERLNRDRRRAEKKKDILKKKVYTINTREYYKFIDMSRSYFIRKDDIPKLSRKPKKLFLYYTTLGEFKKREVIIISPSYSKNLFVAINISKQNFIEYRLEDKD